MDRGCWQAAPMSTGLQEWNNTERLSLHAHMPSNHVSEAAHHKLGTVRPAKRNVRRASDGLS